MTERPILFSAPMVRAILDGRKTQTRRIAPINDLSIQSHGNGMVTWCVEFSKAIRGVIESRSGGRISEEHARRVIASSFNPYGRPGDRLWVRESFMPAPLDTPPNQPTPTSWSIAYAAGGQEEKTAPPGYNPMLYNYERWSPSIHMPRWASRITLEITEVRVERLQAINRGDAMEEGCPFANMQKGPDPRDWFRDLWQTINGPGSWDADPWVWVIGFRRMTP